jgi:hypothetical protein
MTRYIGCAYARERLEGVVDGEVSVDEQVAVESHVRWCRTCQARMDDQRLIGAAIRIGSPAQASVGVMSAVQSHVLLRLEAEREQSLGVRLRESFADLRLLWPALGATCAVAVCVAVAFGVLQRASVERPESLAMMIEAMGNPGSERNPLWPDNRARVDPYFAKYVDSDRAGGISIPRVGGDGAGLDSMPNREAMFTMATVVSREGLIANYELLSERGGENSAEGGGGVQAVLDVVRRSRFAPAQTPIGRAVAVNMVWVIFFTTVDTSSSSPAALLVSPGLAHTGGPEEPVPPAGQLDAAIGSPIA